MSDQHLHINYSLADIERYLQGKMSSAEMYAMEKAALHDEFLADAIEGYTTASVPQSQHHLQQIREALLGQKEEAKVVPIITQKNNWFKIAASVIAVVGVGIIAWLAVNNSSQKIAPLAKAEPATTAEKIDSLAITTIPSTPKPINNTTVTKPAAIKSNAEVLINTITKSKEIANAEANDALLAKREGAAIDSAKEQLLKNELARSKVANYKSSPALLAKQHQPTLQPLASESIDQALQAVAPLSVDQALQGGVERLEAKQYFAKDAKLKQDIRIRGTGSITGNNQPLYIIDGIPRDSSAMAAIKTKDIKSVDVIKNAQASAMYGARANNGVVSIVTNNQVSNVLRGRVADPYGNGISNASINITPGNRNIVTDKFGNFSFSAPDTSAYVKVNSIGYLPATAPLSANLSNNIVLNPNNDALGEVVVIGYGTQKRKDITGSVASVSAPAKTSSKDSAMPVGGWQSFNSYLNQKVGYLFDTAAQNTVVIRDRNGNELDEVELEFSIDKKGTPYDIKVIEDIDADKAKAITNIVKEGPKWTGSKKRNRTKIALKAEK